MNRKTVRNLNKKRERTRPQHKWTKTQTVSLLKAVLDRIEGDPERLEQPTSNKFYSSIFKEYSLEDLEMLGTNIVKNKMRNLRESYLKAEAWIDTTGTKLLEEGKQEKFRENLDKICLNYSYLVKIFGLTKREQLVLDENDIGLIEMNSPQENLKTDDMVDYETASEEYETIIEDQLPVKVRYNINPINTNIQNGHKIKRPNPFIEHMAMTQEKSNEIEEKKMKMQTIYEEERFQIERGMLKVKREKLDFYRKMEETRFDLEKKKIVAELELKKLDVEKQFELKKYELELKYKCNNNQ